MSVFNYTAVDANGKAQTGVIEGDSANAVKNILKQRGLTLIEATRLSADQARAGLTKEKYNWLHFKLKSRVSVTDVATITYQLATLIAAGVAVEAALTNIATELENHGLKQVLLRVRSKVMEGYALAVALEEHPKIFPKLYIASVAVGEKSGKLDVVLKRLAEFLEKQKQVQEKIFQALIYPSLLTIVAIAIVMFLLVYAIPQISQVFAQTGQQLPQLTVILLNVSTMLQNYGWYLLFLFLISILVVKYALKNPRIKYKWHKFLLKIPVLNKTIIAVNVARFYRTFGILFASGVDAISAMRSANSIVTLLPMHNAVNKAIIKVGEGESIHQSLQKTKFFSSVSSQLIASAEASGELETMLQKAAEFQEQITSRKLNTALALFEPLLILLMGFAVLFIVLAILLPIFDMNQLI